MKKYLTLLRNEPVLRRLSLIQLIAYFGAWFSNVAIYTLLVKMEVNPGVIALTAALHFLPGVLQAPLSGTLIDRYAPKQLMLILMAVQIVTTLPLVMVDDLSELWLLFLLVFIRMGAASFYFTLEMSLLPRILDSGKLKLANEIHSMIWSLSYTVGMAVSGFVVYLVGVKMAFILDAILFGVGFMLLAPLLLPSRKPARHEHVLVMIKESFSYLREKPLLKHLILLHAFVGFTAFDALVALMVDHYYAPTIAVALAIGLLHAFRAAGLVIGPMIIGKWINNRNLLYLFAFQGITIFIWAAVVESFIFSLVASVLVGLGTTTLWSYTYTLIQTHTDEHYYGRIVSYNDMIFLLTVALASLAVGQMAEWSVPLPVITALLGATFLVGMLYYLWIQKRYTIKEINHDI